MGGPARPPAKSVAEGKPIGYQWQTWGPGARKTAYWEWSGERWVKISANEFKGKGSVGEYLDPVTLNIGPISVEGQSGLSESLRWPADTLDDQSDWVFFQFGKYPKPFGRDVRRITGINDNADKTRRLAGHNMANLAEYNNSAAALGLDREDWGSSDVSLKLFGKAVMLPVPQDVANEIQQTWQGKQFTAAGRAAVSALAAGNFSPANQVLKNIAGNFEALQTSVNSLALNTLPGVGGNISFNLSLIHI